MLGLGIDLSGRSTGITAAAVLSGKRAERPRLTQLEQRGLRGEHGDQRLLELAREVGPASIAIDAPLTLPHTITCKDPDCARCFPADGPSPSYGSRALDAKATWVERGHATKEPMPMSMIAALAFRGIYLTRLFEREEFRVIETWPMGVYRALDAQSSRRTRSVTDDAWRQRTLARVVDGLHTRRSTNALGTDALDAVAAAYTAWAHAHRCAEPVTGPAGEDDEGAIWLPRQPR